MRDPTRISALELARLVIKAYEDFDTSDFDRECDACDGLGYRVLHFPRETVEEGCEKCGGSTRYYESVAACEAATEAAGAVLLEHLKGDPIVSITAVALVAINNVKPEDHRKPCRRCRDHTGRSRGGFSSSPDSWIDCQVCNGSRVVLDPDAFEAARTDAIGNALRWLFRDMPSPKELTDAH